MDSAKKAAFVRAGRKRFAKGGMAKLPRKRFAAGGTALAGPTTAGTNNAVNPNTGVTGTIGGWFGTNNDFQASGANIQYGTNADQLSGAYLGSQDALNAQTNYANTLAPQVGGAVANQNALAQQYYDMTQGNGPNPAQNQLAQATAKNVANQNALMAGQRGAAGNVGLLARQAAQQGAATQQEAAGQAATLGSQQQIAAQQNLAGLANNQIAQTGQATVGTNQAQQNEQSILQGANTAANNANVGIQSNINNVNAQTAAGNQKNAQGIMGGLNSGLSALSGGLLAHGGAVEKEHHVKLAEMNAASLMHGREKFAEGGIPYAGGSIAASGNGGGLNIEATPQFSTGPTGYGDNAEAGKKAGKGIKDYFDKGEQSDEEAQQGYLDADSALGVSGVDNAEMMMPAAEGAGAEGGIAGLLGEAAPLAVMAAHGGMMNKPMGGPHGCHVANYLAEGGPVKAMVSPGEIYLSPEQADRVVNEDVDPAKIGHKFKGKAKVKGDSYKNDTIPADLEEGGVVIDRKNMSTAEKRKLFVHKTKAKKKARG